MKGAGGGLLPEMHPEQTHAVKTKRVVYVVIDIVTTTTRKLYNTHTHTNQPVSGKTTHGVRMEASECKTAHTYTRLCWTKMRGVKGSVYL